MATSSASSLLESLRSSWARCFAERRLQVAEHEALLGPVDSRAANAHVGCDVVVAGARVGGQQNLRSFELACGVLASAQKRREVGAFGLAQLDPIAYIDLRLLFVRGTEEQLIGWPQ